MKVLLYAGKHRLVFRNVPKPPIGAHEVLLKICSVGICGTDLHIYNGGTSVRKRTIIGHEFSGDVAAVGKAVQNLRRGDRVVGEHVVRCGKCYYCLHGKPNLCLRSQILGMDRPGALSEYMAIPADLVYRIPRSISYDEGALIEPLTIALFAASRAGFLLEKRIAVVGQGPIGLLLDQVLEAGGAHVIGIDILPHRLEFAKRRGWVHITLNPKSRTFQQQLAKAAPLGVDMAFEAVGREATAAMCIDITRRDGAVFILGVFELPATLDLMKLIRKELALKGSWTCAFSFPSAIEMVAEGKITLSPLITHTYKFADAPKAFADSLRYTGNRIKSVIRVA